MKIHYDIDNLPEFHNAVVTIGTFDGVHRGHRQIIDRLKTEAAAINGETVIITFHPHPRKVVSSAIPGIRLINTLNEKIELLQNTGIDHLVVVPFTSVFANQSAEDYVKDFLVSKFHPHTVIIGYDHRFGKERKGDYLLLENMAAECNYVLKEIPKQMLDEISISSTKIREALGEGKIEIADKLLGYEFFFSGVVVDGDKLGRKLGYPTANLQILDEEKIIPGNGIYAIYIEIRNMRSEGENSEKKNDLQSSGINLQLTTHYSRYKGMMSIGFRPTVGGTKKVVEVNIFDFNEEIYGQPLKVFVKKYLREEIKFNNLEDLAEQIGKDKVESLKVL